MTPGMTATITLTLFGGLAGRVRDQPLELPSSARAQSLLGYLALHQGTPQRRDYLAYALWPDSTEEQARNNLRQTLFGLTHRAPELASVLLSTRAEVTLAEEGCQVDTQDFGRRTARLPSIGQGGDVPSHVLTDLVEAASLYQGELLPQLGDEWFSLPRERFRRQIRQVLLALVVGYRQRGDLGSALANAQHLAALDPLDEEAHRLLADLQWRSGRVDLARATLDGLTTRLRSELDTDPDPETVALGRRLERRANPSDRRAAAAILAPPGFGQPSWEFVGREDELSAIGSAWRETARGRGWLMVVTGDAGIGKTRLIQEAIGRLDPRPGAVLIGRARPEAAGSFVPLVDAVRHALSQLPPTAWPELPAPWGPALTAFLPELGDAGPLRNVPWQYVNEGWTLLLRRGFSQPIVLVIDDLQWLDDATLAYLPDLCQGLAESHVLILASARSGDIGIETEVGALVAQFERRGVARRVHLSQLSASESTMLVRAVGGHLTAEYASQLTRWGAGHPLFLVELTRAAATAGFTLAGLDPPDSVRALIVEQARRFPFDSQFLLQALSVTGAATGSLLGAVLDWPEDRVAAAAVAPLRHHLLLETGLSLSFAHDLMREAIRGNLAGPVRRQWHRKVAEAHDRSSGLEQAGLAAEHYLAAGDELAALPRLLTAGETDLRRPAPDAAVRHFDRAATLSRRLGRDAERLRALVGLGTACLGAQRIDAAADAYEVARGEAMVLLDQSAQIQALAGLMQVAFARDQIAEALGLIRQALTLPVAPEDEVAERALVQATSRIVPIYGILRPLWAEGREHVGRMLRVAERIGEKDAARTLAVNLIHLTKHFHGPWPAAVADFRRLGEPFGAAWILTWMGRAHEAIAEAEAAIAIARRRSDHVNVAAAQSMLGTAVALIGDYQTGFQLIDRSIDQSLGHREQNEFYLSTSRVIVFRELGLWASVREQARRHNEAAATLRVQDSPFQGIVEAAQLQAEARLTDAHAALDQLQVRVAQLTHPDYVLDRLMALIAEADVALLVGSLDHARRSADAAIQLANTLGAERELAHAHRLRALGAHREGEHPAAEADLAEARDIATQVGEPTLRWRVLIAEVELRRGTSNERALLAAEEAIRANLPASLQAAFGVGSITLH